GFDAVVVRHEDARPRRVFGNGARRGSQRPRATARGAARQRFAPLLVEVAPLRAGALAGHVRDLGVAQLGSVLRAVFGGSASAVVAHGSMTSVAWPGAG